jgi:ribonucleotide reductase alpha subunit
MKDVGIVSYGAHIPRLRIKSLDIAHAWGKDPETITGGLGVFEKSVPSPDQDVATISVEAARAALLRTNIDPQDIGAVYVGSESHPYAVKPTGTIVGEAIGATPLLKVADYEFACKAGTAAIQTCMALVKAEMVRYGIRNSLLTTIMPTASTAQILGNNECVEPFTSNLYTRRVLSGEFICVNKHLQKRLGDLWTPELVNVIKKDRGSIQKTNIPDDIKKVYKTVWEISQKVLIDMAADRGKYICQSQSMNLFLDGANYSKLSSMHFYAWEKGLKTGIYYLRSRPKANPIQFTVVDCTESCESCSA